MSSHHIRVPRVRRQQGATLIELMIAMLLGLVVVAAASGLFLTNKRVYASTETVNRIQENVRVAFEMMARDIREAGGNPCGRTARVVSQMEGGPTGWWDRYFDGLRGYGGGSPIHALHSNADGEILDVYTPGGPDIYVTQHAGEPTWMDVTSVSGLSAPDVLMVCNREVALIFEATELNSKPNPRIQHTPGGKNCTNRFRDHYDCDPGGGSSSYCLYTPGAPGITPPGSSCTNSVSNNPARVARLQSFRWYVGTNSRGERSLYRATLSGDPGLDASITDVVEVAEGISDMQLEYWSEAGTAWQPVSAIGDWATVNAVRVTLTATGTDGALAGGYLEGTDGDVLSRTVSHVVALRNREAVL